MSTSAEIRQMALPILFKKILEMFIVEEKSAVEVHRWFETEHHVSFPMTFLTSIGSFDQGIPILFNRLMLNDRQKVDFVNDRMEVFNFILQLQSQGLNADQIHDACVQRDYMTTFNLVVEMTTRSWER